MYFVPMYPPPYYPMAPVYDYRGIQFDQGSTPYYFQPMPMEHSKADCEHERQFADQEHKRQFADQGSEGYVVNIREMARRNNTFRTAVWTGNHLQVTVMSIPAGVDIGLEVHSHGDQFIRVEEGEGIVRMGDTQYNLHMEESVNSGSAIMIPAGKWHNVINTGNRPLKLYTIYAPPEHPFGTVHETKEAAMAAENDY